MSKSIFLYVNGGDYAALGFEQNFNTEDVYKEMVTEGVTEKTYESDDYYFDVAIKEFGEVDPEFINFLYNYVLDYDMMKSENFYLVDTDSIV